MNLNLNNIFNSNDSSLITKLTSYSDNRIHISFDDKSSLVIHKGSTCCTYYHKNNSQMRFFLSNPPIKENIRGKINTSLLFANLFNEQTILTENLIELSKNDIQFFHYKKETSLWDINTKIENLSDNTTLIIRSIDGMAHLSYNPNKMFLKIEYFQVMPRKKMVYCQNKERFFSKRLDSQPNKPVFEYIKIRKYYNIYECPLKWQIPLFLCMKHCVDNNIQMIYKPIISNEILELFSQENIEIWLEESLSHFSDFEFISSKEFIIKMNADSYIFVNDLKEQSLNSENIWKNDRISPSTELMNHEKPINFLYNDHFLIWLLKNNEILLNCLLDESFIFSTNKSLYFHHIFPESQEEEMEIVYCSENLPVKIQSKIDINITYLLQNTIEFALKGLRFNDCFEKNKAFTVKTKEKEHNSYIEHYKEINENGTFIAYEDLMVKCCFSDRTLVSIDKTGNFVMILTKNGENIMQKLSENNEFSNYVNLLLAFKKNAFITEKEKNEENERKKERRNLVDFELEKSNRFLNILSNKIPIEENIENYEPNTNKIEMNVEMELEKNQRFLDDLKNLLK